jgi:hypothetical protein
MHNHDILNVGGLLPHKAVWEALNPAIAQLVTQGEI